MTLGKPTQCWICWQLKSYIYQEERKGSFNDYKQFCTPIKSGRNTVLEGTLVWVCSECRKNVKRDKK